MHLNSFSIARMMVVTTVATIVMLAGAGLYAWVRLDDVANVAAHAANHLEPQLGRVAEIELNITRTSLLARHLMLVRTPADQQATFAEIGEKRKAVETAVTGFRDNVSNDQARELFRELERRLAEFWTIAGKNLELTLAGRKDEAFDHLVSTLVPARNRLLDSIKVLRLHQRSLLSEAVQLAALDVRRTKGVLGVLLGLVMLGVVLAASFTTRQIRRRVALVTETAAREASDLVGAAADVASRGGEVMTNVVSTMAEISERSRRIADIIGAIDDIAFQTNILALNAAVEAARAGEQGRGFSVVAAAVRALAQRSAAAARESKALITSSVERVESGSRLVSEAGATMTELVSSVRRVSDIISGITASAREQSSGIAQVNDAMQQIEQRTRQNGALVEEAAAAAQSLREQVESLSGVVNGFTLPDQLPTSHEPRAERVEPVFAVASGPRGLHHSGERHLEFPGANDAVTPEHSRRRHRSHELQG